MTKSKYQPKKFWVDKGAEFPMSQKSLKRWRKQNCSTMSETKAAFAEHTILSLKKILYCYIEDKGYKYIHKVPQFVRTLSSGKSGSMDF